MLQRSMPAPFAVVPAAIAALTLAAWQGVPSAHRAAGALRHQAYVWQRAWTPAVADAAAAAAVDPRFTHLAVLAGEISFASGRAPQVVRVRPAYACLVCSSSGSGVSPLSSEPGRLCDSSRSGSGVSPLSSEPGRLCHSSGSGSGVSPLSSEPGRLCHSSKSGSGVSPLSSEPGRLCDSSRSGSGVSPLSSEPGRLCHSSRSGSGVSPLSSEPGRLCDSSRSGSGVSPPSSEPGRFCHSSRSGSGVSPLSSEPGRLCHSIALAIRVGPYSGPFGPEAPAWRALRDLTLAVLAEAHDAGAAIDELQIDFDCSEAKLDGYRRWLAALRPLVAPARLTFTALPCWLDRPGFAALAASTDGYVLQVHSLHRPAAGQAVLCDAAEARRAVEAAGALARPFRVALPTYGYLVAFDAAGRMLGLSAEATPPGWPRGTRVELAESDPAEMAALVRDWTADRPAAMQGVIWYRLPVAGERLNWGPATLAAVMDGRAPAAKLQARVRRAEDGLAEVMLANAGEADARGTVSVRLQWTGPAAEAADALAGFRIAAAGEGELRLLGCVGPQAWPLRAGQERNIGWIRLGSDREILCHVEASAQP